MVDKVAVVVPVGWGRWYELADFLGWVSAAARAVYVVSEESTPPSWDHVVHVPCGPGKNIPAWWNAGLAAAREDGYRFVTWAETDVVLPPDELVAMAEALDSERLAMVGPDFFQTGNHAVRREPGAVPVLERIAQCFLVDASRVDARMDPRFTWWYADADLEWRLRKEGGTRLVHAPRSSHPVHGTTPVSGELARVVERDREHFHAKWGGAFAY
jgi:GT2 family glycosyltransferase